MGYAMQTLEYRYTPAIQRGARSGFRVNFGRRPSIHFTLEDLGKGSKKQNSTARRGILWGRSFSCILVGRSLNFCRRSELPNQQQVMVMIKGFH